MIVYVFSIAEQRKSKVDKVTIGNELLYVASVDQQKAYSSRVFWEKVIYERPLWGTRGCGLEEGLGSENSVHILKKFARGPCDS